MSSPLQLGKPRVAIVGAGIAGLTLACLLQQAALPCKIFEAVAQQKLGHNYGIHLKKPSQLATPRLDTPSRISACLQALDGIEAATSQAQSRHAQSSRLDKQKYHVLDSSFLAADRDVRRYLISHLEEHAFDISWDSRVASVDRIDGGNGIRLSFVDGHREIYDIVVNASGLRNPVGRTVNPILLPYCTYNGSRRISPKEWHSEWQDFFGDNPSIDFVACTREAPYFSIQRIKTSASSDNDLQHVEIRWTYSRPAKDKDDPLYRPNRTPEESKDIPDLFYQEFAEAVPIILQQQSRPNVASLVNALSIKRLKGDRILHWHLRVHPNFVAYTSDDTGSFISIGDAAHGLPIVKSYGAQLAMRDAIRIAERLTRDVKKDSDEVLSKVDRINDFADYTSDTTSAINQVRRIHSQPDLSPAELQSLLGIPVSRKLEIPGNRQASKV